jgi:hypothetical protein
MHHCASEITTTQASHLSHDLTTRTLSGAFGSRQLRITSARRGNGAAKEAKKKIDEAMWIQAEKTSKIGRQGERCLFHLFSPLLFFCLFALHY